MSMDPQTLQKLLIEMDNQLNKSRADLSICNAQLSRVDTNVKIIDSSTARLGQLTAPGDPVWKGVGRAFVRNDVSDYLAQIAHDKKAFLDTQKLLKTKQHYLETTLENTLKSMSDIVGKGN